MVSFQIDEQLHYNVVSIGVSYKSFSLRTATAVLKSLYMVIVVKMALAAAEQAPLSHCILFSSVVLDGASESGKCATIKF